MQAASKLQFSPIDRELRGTQVYRKAILAFEDTVFDPSFKYSTVRTIVF